MNHLWAVILAGGEGSRVRPLTRLIDGDDRPKQFCRIFSGRTLVQETRSRLLQLINPRQTFYAVVRDHQRYYDAECPDVPRAHMVVQPSDRGTTAAILYSLLRITREDKNAVVAFFPSDHHFADPEPLYVAVRSAAGLATEQNRLVALLGAVATHPETDYGWIEPGRRLEGSASHPAYAVNRFWEKPERRLAEALLERNCLWNTFIMVGRASAYLDLAATRVPRVVKAFEGMMRKSGGSLNREGADDLYRTLAPGDFSRQVLSVSAPSLCVLPLADAGWSDLGTPSRVLELMRQRGVEQRRLDPTPAYQVA
jgi:mannose-1-phosphate guanylyltransferase